MSPVSEPQQRRLFPRQVIRPDAPAASPGAVTFGLGTPMLVSARLALGADLTADPQTWVWTDITSYVRYQPGVTVSTGRADEAARVQPGSARLTLDNRDGRFSRKNPLSPYYGQLTRNTPIWVTINPGNGEYDVLKMFVNEWPSRWDKSGKDFTVPITCAGILRRLIQAFSSKPVVPPLVTYTETTSPVAWWPLDDGKDVTTLHSPTPACPTWTPRR
jgi:hypothetical protein